MFETAEHIVLPIVIALLTGGLVAGIMSQRTAARVAYVNGLRDTVQSMQTEMEHMAERLNLVRLELSANQVTISDLRAQISTLQSRNFDLVDQITVMRREAAIRTAPKRAPGLTS